MIPLWVKIAYTVGALAILVIYWFRLGWQNYLWFSDIALIVTIPALWLESGFLASMMAVGVLLPETVWNVSFFGRLLTGRRLSGLTDYMFDPDFPVRIKALSLFHVPLPIVLFWLVMELGYEPWAVVAQTGLAWVVLPLSWLVTDRERNINWVHEPLFAFLRPLSRTRYRAFVMVAVPAIGFLPTHALLYFLFAG